MTESITTTFTELIGVRYPIVQAGMSWASSASALPVAVSEAGGLGVVAAGPLRIDDLATVLSEVRAGTARPWAVNLPLYRKNADVVIELLLNDPPPVLIAGQGSPKRYVSAFKSVGTVCIHIVASIEHAAKAVEAGADAVIAVGAEAGGHPPVSQVSTLVQTRSVVSAFPDLPVIASGGLADGAGLAAVLALGAAAGQFGTRFLLSTESAAHPDYKESLLRARVDDTRFVGRGLGPIRAVANDFTATMEELEQSGAPVEERSAVFDGTVLREAIREGDVRRGKVEAGQSVGLIDSIEPAGDIVNRIVTEYDAAVDRLARAAVEPVR